MINTKDLRGDVGVAVQFRMTARDYRGVPISLISPAAVWMAVTADAKVSPLFTLSSLDSLDCSTVSLGPGRLNSVFAARPVTANFGAPITVALIGDGVSNVSITSVGNAVTIHYVPDVSTIGQVEAAVIAATANICPIVVKTPGTSATVLSSGAAFTSSMVTAVVILDQNSYTGQAVVTITRDRSKLLLPTGDDDPYLWDAAGINTNGLPFTIASRSRLSMFATSSASSLPG